MKIKLSVLSFHSLPFVRLPMAVGRRFFMCKYDLIVVGAGNAGLSAAATAQKSGLKTIVFEKNLLPGGSATDFRRGRFEFEASLHELANVGTEEQYGSFRRLLDSYGADVDWCIEKNAFRVIAGGEDGYDIRVPSGVADFCSAIDREVPGSLESLEQFFVLVNKIDAALKYLSSGRPDPAVLASEHTDFLRMASHSVDECLNALGMPRKAQNILKTYWPYIGASTAELDFAHYATLLDRYINTYPAVPRLRSHGLSLATEKVIRDNGGEIRYNSAVDEVLFDNGRAVGVRVGNERFYAKNIILNCFPEVAYRDLIPESECPERAIRLANARKYGSMFFTVYLGLDASAEELGIEDYSVFLYDTPDSVEQYNSCNNPLKSFLIVNCLNKIVPNASEKGTSMLFFTTLLTEDAWGDVKPEDYKRVKNRIAKGMIEKYEREMKLNIMPHIEEIVISAPPTFARYLSTPNGTPYGYEMQSWDTMIARIINSKNEQFIPGLYFVGAHQERSDGYSPTYSNGHSVANKLVKEHLKSNGKA